MTICVHCGKPELDHYDLDASGRLSCPTGGTYFLPIVPVEDTPKKPWGFSDYLEVLPSAQPQSTPPGKTSGFEHAVDKLAQRIIDENRGTLSHAIDKTAKKRLLKEYKMAYKKLRAYSKYC
ncbi:MAG: hypothetical protein ACYCRE_02405 [Acidobacteriaceae bacterium]